MIDERKPVLIVGAGGAGLSLALLLLQQGIRPVLVEQRAQVSWYPRARNLNFRSMEIFRALGLADEIRTAGARVSRIVGRQQLASPEEKELLNPASLLDTTAFSPEPYQWYCPQSRLEPILVAAARRGGADVRYATELVNFIQEEHEVIADLKDHSTGDSYTLRAQFLAGCDGTHSAIREALRVPVLGEGPLDEHYVFIYFRAAWDELIRGHEADAFLIENADVHGMFLVAEKDLGMFVLRTPAPEQIGAFTRERCQELLTKAIGKPTLAVDIIEVVPWRPVQSVAERFQIGNVFLVGDSAHTMPAKEGLGVNSAIQGAQNLGWKLASVLNRHASRELLSTYTTERQPVAWFSAQHSLTGPAAALIEGVPLAQKESEFFPTVGYRYSSQAILSEDGPLPPSGRVVLLDRGELTGIPGTRVPHVWLARGSARVSTLDLLNGDFVLLTGVAGADWCEAALRLSHSIGVRISAYRIGPAADLCDPAGDWAAKMGILPEGTILLRPDGFVAWRCRDAASEPEVLLGQAIKGILCRVENAG